MGGQTGLQERPRRLVSISIACMRDENRCTHARKQTYKPQAIKQVGYFSRERTRLMFMCMVHTGGCTTDAKRAVAAHRIF